jgi:hypothetical protein
MNTPGIVIAAGARTGSSAIWRALNLIPGISLAHQPKFASTASLEALRAELDQLMAAHSGFKYLIEDIGGMFEDDEFWLSRNAAILNHPGNHVVFLRRRSEFHRMVSHHVAKTSGHWGFFGQYVSATETVEYKEFLASVTLPPLDEEDVSCNVEHRPAIQERLRQRITSPVLDLFYEDMFGPEVDYAARVRKFRELVQFFQIESDESIYESQQLALLLNPSGKLNDESIYERIPNYRELLVRYEDHRPRSNRVTCEETSRG